MCVRYSVSVINHTGCIVTFHTRTSSGRRFIRNFFGLSFGLNKGLRFHFDSETCLNYPIFEHFLSVGKSQAKTQVVFQAETQAKIFLLNWAPAALPITSTALPTLQTASSSAATTSGASTTSNLQQQGGGETGLWPGMSWL